MIEEKYRGIRVNILLSEHFICRRLDDIKSMIDVINVFQKRIMEYSDNIIKSLLAGDIEGYNHYASKVVEYHTSLEKEKNNLKERLKSWEQTDKRKIPIFYLRKYPQEIYDDLSLLHRAKEFYEDELEIKLKEQSETDTEHYTLVVGYLERLTEELKKFSK